MGRIVLHLTQMAKASPIKFIKWKPFNLRIQKQQPGTVSNPRKTASNSESTGHDLNAVTDLEQGSEPSSPCLGDSKCSSAAWHLPGVPSRFQNKGRRHLCALQTKWGYLGRPKVIFQTIFEVKSSCAHFLFEHNHFKAEVRKPRVWAWFHSSFLLQSPPQSGYSFDIIMVLFLVTWGYYGTHYS